MKFSVSIAMAPPEQYIPVAQAAERLGYHAVVLPDSIFFSEEVSKPYPYTKDGSRMWDAETPWIEPIVGAAAMAAATETIFFYTSVVKLPVRHPVLGGKASRVARGAVEQPIWLRVWAWMAPRGVQMVWHRFRHARQANE